MIELNFRNLTSGEQQNCVIGIGTTPPQYRIFITAKTEAQINADAAAGWRMWWVKEVSENKINGVQVKDGNFAISCSGGGGLSNSFAAVGRAHNSYASTTSEFLVSRSWTFGEIAQTAFLFLIASTLIFYVLWKIFRKKNSYDI